MIAELEAVLKEALPDWSVGLLEDSLPEAGAGQAWRQKLELKLEAPAAIPQTGKSGLVILVYDSASQAREDFAGVIETVKRETLSSLPPFLEPGAFSLKEEQLADQYIAELSLPLTIMEDEPHVHYTGAIVCQRGSATYVAYGAHLENARRLGALVVEQKI